MLSHDASVNALTFTHDGQFLLSSGNDNRMKLWRAGDGSNTLVNFGRVKNHAFHAHQIAIANDDRTVFHPNGKSVL